MDVPDNQPEESLVDYANRLAVLHRSSHADLERGDIGQFFTASSVARLMASMFDVIGQDISILDPGAGTGILTAALCERLLEERKVKKVLIDVYDTDETVAPYLEAVLGECKKRLVANDVEVSYLVIQHDFILSNIVYTKEAKMLDGKVLKHYDLAISNPPYYKLNKDSPQSKAMKEIVAGQPNIYSLFMALTSRMLKQNGQMVFITPRSFCSGLYFKKFREWFLSKNRINAIHIFESRKAVFDGGDVLQENIITKSSRGAADEQYDVKITVSKDKGLTDLRSHTFPSGKLVYRQNGDVFIRIPSSEDEITAIDIIDTWKSNIHSIGLEISTGPVVDFRTEFLCNDMQEKHRAVPLLWAKNLRDGRVKWPNGSSDKPMAIEDRKETENILLPMRNYVLIKRFSSKEQKRRLDASVLLRDDLPYSKIGLENHLNYIYKIQGELGIEEAFGIATLLNSKLVDLFFRSMNGHTQVNATEIRAMPFPTIEKVREIGRKALSNHGASGLSPERILSEVLGMDYGLKGKADG